MIPLAKRYNPSSQYQTIADASRTTGLSQYFIRHGCRNKSIPYIKSGNKYLINVPLLLQCLNRQSESNAQVVWIQKHCSDDSAKPLRKNWPAKVHIGIAIPAATGVQARSRRLESLPALSVVRNRIGNDILPRWPTEAATNVWLTFALTAHPGGSITMMLNADTLISLTKHIVVFPAAHEILAGNTSRRFGRRWKESRTTYFLPRTLQH